jgi:hypothetical protein
VFLLQTHLKSHLGIFEGNPVATRPYFIIKKKNLLVFIKKRKQKEKAHQDISSIQNDEAVGLCTDCSWEGAGVRGGLWCFRVTSAGVTEVSCAFVTILTSFFFVRNGDSRQQHSRSDVELRIWRTSIPTLPIPLTIKELES